MTDEKIKIEPFHNQPADDASLYRYVTIDKLLDFLFSGRIPLVRLTEFNDRLEGVDIQHLLWNYTGDKLSEDFSELVGGTFKYITTNFFPTKRNNYSRQREIFQRSNFASCWYVSNHESVAMWQLYSNPDSVAIRVPYKNISDEIKNYNFKLPHNQFVRLRYGCIDYHRFNNLDELSKIVLQGNSQGFTKDESFRHENEFRIMLESKVTEEKKVERKPMILDEQVKKLNELYDIKVIPFDLVNFKDLPFEIVFHPQSFDWHRKNIIKIIDKFELKYKTSESVLRDIFK